MEKAEAEKAEARLGAAGKVMAAEQVVVELMVAADVGANREEVAEAILAAACQAGMMVALAAGWAEQVAPGALAVKDGNTPGTLGS